MAVDLEDLAMYCRDTDVFPADEEPFAVLALKAAQAMVTRYLRGGTPPVDVEDAAVLQLGSEILERRKSPAGIRQLGEGQSFRVSSDPMRSVVPLLAVWRGLGVPL